MEIPTSTYRKLLNDTERIIKHQKEIAVLKGETFNVFSILKMEHRENETHSAFLGELLNPKGSHNLDSIFLALFLKQLDLEQHLNHKAAKVTLEKSIGKRSDRSLLGGRIDIYINDNDGKSICIENKIHATDQNVQITRYCNHNSEKNKVYYLNLDGHSPSKESHTSKIKDEDFFIISYKKDILNWLEQCQKEAAQYPIIRESIHQYAILIKKLTNQLTDRKMEKEVEELIISNYKASSTIANNIENVELQFAKLFIKEVEVQLSNRLSNFTIKISEDLTQPWSGIKISHKNWPNKIFIKLEGNSKIPWSDSRYGIHIRKKNFERHIINEAIKNIDLLQSNFGENEHWCRHRFILNLSTSEERAKLFDVTERKILVDKISGQLIELAQLCEKPFIKLNELPE